MITLRPATLLRTAALSLALVAPVAAQEGKLEFTQRVVDLGETLQHDQLDLEFPFKVTGGPVTVSNIEKYCGCTIGELMVDGQTWEVGKPIPSGSTGALAVEFRAGLYVGEKNATLAVSHGTQRTILEVRTIIHKVFELEPELLRFGNVAVGDNASIDVEIAGVRPWSIVEWTKLPKGIAVDDVTSEHVSGATAAEAQSTRWFRVRILETAGQGGIHGAAEAKTSLGKPLVISLNARVVGLVICSPMRGLNFGLVKPGTKIGRTLYVQSHSKTRALPLPEVSIVDGEAYTLDSVTQEDNGRIDVRVSLSDEAAEGRHTGKLVLTWTGDYANESRELSLSAVVRKKS